MNHTRAGPPLDETLQLFLPLASNLEELKLGDNMLGGTITDDIYDNIAVFTKLTKLELNSMSLGGELALGIGRLRDNGCSVNLSGNKGFTLSSDTIAVKSATKLDFSDMCLRGTCCRGASVRHKRSQLRSESCAGPPLPDTLRLLAPLALTLEKLDLGGNKLGGIITDDIAAFTKLTELRLFGMNLEGASKHNE